MQSDKSSTSDEMNSRMTDTTNLPANIAQSESDNASSSSNLGMAATLTPCLQSGNRPQPGENGVNARTNAGAGVKAGAGAGVDEELSDRVRMMEMSVLLQAEELASAKALFFKVRKRISYAPHVTFVIKNQCLPHALNCHIAPFLLTLHKNL